MMDLAADCAKFQLQHGGAFQPAYLYSNGSEIGVLSRADWDSAEAHTDFGEAVFLLAVARNVTACVLIVLIEATPQSPAGPDPAGSRGGTREFVLLCWEARVGKAQFILPVLRSASGEFTGFGDPQAVEVPEHFSGSIPTQEPSLAERRDAERLLKIRNVPSQN